jgi:hypothetical protein
MKLEVYNILGEKPVVRLSCQKKCLVANHMNIHCIWL